MILIIHRIQNFDTGRNAHKPHAKSLYCKFRITVWGDQHETERMAIRTLR